MKVVEVQFIPWDKVYYFDPDGMDLKPGDRVIVKTDLGVELGEVIRQVDINESDLRKQKESEASESEEEAAVIEAVAEDKETADAIAGENSEPIIKPVLRLAAIQDFDKLPVWSEKKAALDYCKERKSKLGLPMKFFDVHFSFDGSRITFAFIADGRIDFRELVKELTRHFGRTIRLQQIGIRDEAKIMGDVGHCGKPLCCRKHLRELSSITSEMAELQQCSHRGSERISGACGRLMCCLNYEQNGYEALFCKIPPLGAKVNVDGKHGIVVGHHILKQSVDVKFPGENDGDGTVVEVDLNRKKA